MRLSLLVGSIVTAALLAVPGCATPSQEARSSLALTHPNSEDHVHAELAALLVSEEQVRGHFYLVGGPPGPPKPLPGTVTFTGPVTRQVSVGNDGRIVTELPPGHYRAEGVSPMMGGGGYPCRPDSKLKVKPNTVVHVNVYCRVP